MKNCDNCNSEFNPYRPQQKYCDVCKGNSKLYAKDHYKKKAIVCPCGALTGSKNIYCSSECKKSYGNTLEVAVTRYENFVSIEGEIPLKIGALKWQEPYQNQATQAQRVLQFQ